MVNVKRMTEQLLLHEGIRLVPYLDTEGNWTIGVGYNITGRGWDVLEKTVGRKVGIPGALRAEQDDRDGWVSFTSPDVLQKMAITKAEAFAVLQVDIARVTKAVRVYFPEYDALDEVRQRVCVDIAFNIGFKALGFKKCIAAIKRRDWSAAARELWDSRWSGQVGDGPGKKRDRADRLTGMLLTGVDYVS